MSQKYADKSRLFGEFLIYLCDIIKNGHLAQTCAISPFLYEKLMQEKN
ncbi:MULTISPECIES: hypothetical protein [unclassified Campylobacter]|nr:MULTISPECIES: hypothetical protein [unclassified Campylobacter]